MHTHSDITGLFSKLSDNAGRYQEIDARRSLDAVGSRWALLREVHGSMSASCPRPSASPERPPRG